MGIFSVALGTATDCDECAGLLVDQLREHGIEASPDTWPAYWRLRSQTCGAVSSCWHGMVAELLVLPMSPRF
jgi:hypothetical protein